MCNRQNATFGERSEMAKFSDGYAIVVGVGDYSDDRVPNLPATARDAQALGSMLVDGTKCAYEPDRVKILTGISASADRIRGALQTAAEATNKRSTVVVYFSGHGCRTYMDKSWQTYLCPRETDPSNLPRTAISRDEFSTLLGKIPAQKLVVVLDACHSGGSADIKAVDGNVLWKSGLPETFYDALRTGSGRVIIASSKPEEVSFVRKQGDYSVFTWYVLKALEGQAAIRGDGLIHILDLFHFVNEAVQQDRPNQVPILKTQDLDLNFPIALAEASKGTISLMSQPKSQTSAVREAIVHRPAHGAALLSQFLAARPQWAVRRNEVDLRRSELERIESEVELFGISDNDKVAKNRIIYSLLKICQDIEAEM